MIELCNYAHCLDRDCICKSSSETVSWDAHTSKPSAVTLQLRSGFYHDRYKDIAQVVYFLSLSMDINIHAKDLIFFFSHLSRIFILLPSRFSFLLFLMTSQMWAGFISALNRCSKCRNCYLFKLATNYCLFLISKHLSFSVPLLFKFVSLNFAGCLDVCFRS